jgi:iron(III) transport system substrate-binding protein
MNQGSWRRVLVALCSSLVLSGIVLGGSAAKPPPHFKAVSAKAWRGIVGKAKSEGTVNLYTDGNQAAAQAVATAFTKQYGITVNVNRNSTAAIAAQVTAEEGTNNNKADVWVSGAKNVVEGALKNNWVAMPEAPNLFKKVYNQQTNMLGRAFLLGESVLTPVWNTSQHPAAVNDIPDMLTSDWNGKIGVVDPTVAGTAVMDEYIWMEQVYGNDILSKLAALHPKLYVSSSAMTQAVISGELEGAPLGNLQTAATSKAAGAPINFVMADNGKPWNAPNYGMIMKTAPHPDAAQMFLNFWVSVTGQSIANADYGAVIPNVQGTYYFPPRDQDLNDFTPAKVAAFNAQWDSLFGS